MLRDNKEQPTNVGFVGCSACGSLRSADKNAKKQLGNIALDVAELLLLSFRIHPSFKHFPLSRDRIAGDGDPLRRRTYNLRIQPSSITFESRDI